MLLKKALLIGSLFCVIAAVHADAALVKQVIEYSQGDALLEGYLVYDDAVTASRPGILVVHEWMGLNDYAKARADQLAQEGYVAFAADIYGKGIRPTNPTEAGALAGKYKSDRLLLRQRVEAALNELLKAPSVDKSKIAAIGYCFGGTTVLELARSGTDLRGVVSFHGGLNHTIASETQEIKARVLVLHGDADPFVPAAEVDGFEKEMTERKADYSLVKYPGAVHGFTNPNNKGEIPGALYDADADLASWQAMKEFFGKIFG